MTRVLRLTIVLTALSGIAHAQITLDGSLGPGGALIGPNFVIPSSVGQVRGGNLFHSFGLFNVLTNQSATFTGPNTVSNILGRVTGGQSSVIDGLIRSTIPGANLYLMNPAGMLFGPNASINVLGSFHATTADYLKFADGAKFHANLAKQSVLTSAPVTAFGFLSETPSPISIQRSDLRVPVGRTLSMIGGDIQFVGDPVQGALIAPIGRINIASVASPGEVIPNNSTAAPDLDVESFARLGTISITNEALISVTGIPPIFTPAGTIIIRGGQLSFRDTFLEAIGNPGGSVSIKGDRVDLGNTLITASTLGSVDHPGTAVDIQSRGEFVLKDGEIVAASLQRGRGGNIRITAGRIQLGPDDPTNTTLPGFQGTISLGVLGSGRGGNLEISADSLNVKNGFSIDANVIGSSATGNGGDIQVTAESLQVTDSGRISSSIVGGAPGNAGNITLRTGSLDVSNRGGIFTSSILGTGNAGNLEIEAKDVRIAGVSNSTNPFDVGECTCVSTSTNAGRGGLLRLTANNVLITSQGAIASVSRGSGNAGNIEVNSDSLFVTDRATISASGLGAGKGGDITITARQVKLQDSGPLGGIVAANFATGDAGNIRITATDKFTSRDSRVTTQSIQGDGGDIDIRAGSLLHLLRSRVTTAVGTGDGEGGNITIDPRFVVLNNSEISANAFGGPGGNIKIVADVFLASPDSSVTASSALSAPGTVDIQAAITNVSGLLQPLPENIFQATSLLQQSCAARFSGGKLSSLAVGSRDGLPLEPGGFMPSPLYRLGSQPDTSITQRNASSKSDRLTLASVKPPFSVNWPCTK